MRSIIRIVLAVLLGVVSAFAQTPPTEEGTVVPAQTSTMGAAAQSAYELRKAASERLLQQEEIVLSGRGLRNSTYQVVLYPKRGQWQLYGRHECFRGIMPAKLFVNKDGYLTMLSDGLSGKISGCTGVRINIDGVEQIAGSFDYDPVTKKQSEGSSRLFLGWHRRD